MESFLNWLPEIFYPINVIDILIIAVALYQVIKIIHDTRAAQLAKGILILFAISIISDTIGLTTVHWVLLQLQKMLIVAIPVIFAPEMRKALAQLGRARFFQNRRNQTYDLQERVINHVATCAKAASESYTGVLIVLNRNDSLDEYISTGIPIDSVVSSALLSNIFVVNTPLHDGAVIIKDGRIAAASCYLPLSESRNISKSLGTRHRAAIGLSEETDAVVVIVSEETGAMSVAIKGQLFYDLSYNALQEMLEELLVVEEKKAPFWKRRGRSHE